MLPSTLNIPVTLLVVNFYSKVSFNYDANINTKNILKKSSNV